MRQGRAPPASKLRRHRIEPAEHQGCCRCFAARRDSAIEHAGSGSRCLSNHALLDFPQLLDVVAPHFSIYALETGYPTCPVLYFPVLIETMVARRPVVAGPRLCPKREDVFSVEAGAAATVLSVHASSRDCPGGRHELCLCRRSGKSQRFRFRSAERSMKRALPAALQGQPEPRHLKSSSMLERSRAEKCRAPSGLPAHLPAAKPVSARNRLPAPAQAILPDRPRLSLPERAPGRESPLSGGLPQT